MQTFLQTIQKISPLSASALKDIESIAIEENFPKKHILIQDLAKCQHLYFIEKGIARAYFYNDGKEITDWFGMENMIIGPTVRNFPLKETMHIVETLEDAVIIKIPFSDLEKLFQKHHDVERLGRIIAIETILHLQYKIDSLQLMSAKERYQDFLQRYPSLINRVSLGQIASYLGMNQVTLSRIRNEIF